MPPLPTMIKGEMDEALMDQGSMDYARMKLREVTATTTETHRARPMYISAVKRLLQP